VSLVPWLLGSGSTLLAQEGAAPGSSEETLQESASATTDETDETDEADDKDDEEGDAPRSDSGAVLRIRIDSAIHPVVSEFVRESLEEAERRRADLLVIELATPGGLVDSMREICTSMLGSEIPVVVYVAPAGSHAASAGFFILMASDIAAMAPGTNTGAAAAVSGEGEEIEGTMGKKVQEDGAAYIRSLASRKGRNIEMAEAAVLEAKSFSAEEALENNLIDLMVPSLTRLLVELDGREIEKNGRTVTLATADARVEDLEMGLFQRILATLANPSIAFLLLSLGGLGIYFELMNPGAIFPGVFGAIALILAFFALSVLPVNYAGVALVLLAIAFFIAEIKVQSFGLLTAGGIVSLVLGGLMLIKTAEPALRVSWQVILAVAVTAALVVGFLFTIAYRAFRNRVRTGSEGLVTERGVVREALDPRGKVWVHGEIWAAEAAEPIPVGEEVEVVAVDGMRLRVRRITDTSPTLPRHAEA